MPKTAADESDMGQGDSNQFDMQKGQIGVGEFHANIPTNCEIEMPSAGVTHGPELHYDQETRSDSNKGV